MLGYGAGYEDAVVAGGCACPLYGKSVEIGAFGVAYI